MKIEDQVPDRELCEALKKAGMPQETLFTWALPHEDEGDEWIIVPSDAPEGWCNDEPRHVVAAPTIAEMGEMMPHHLHSRGDYWGFTVEKVGTGWACTYSNETWDYLRKEQDEKEANARAKLLLWALQNGHVK